MVIHYEEALSSVWTFIWTFRYPRVSNVIPGGWKILRFSTEIAVYLGNVTRSMVAMECEQEVIGGGSVRVDSDDLE